MAELGPAEVQTALESPGAAASRALAFGVDFAATVQLLGLTPQDRLATLARAQAKPFGGTVLAAIDPVRIARHLAAHAVRYVLIGGSAMRARGMQYATEDFDICYDTNEANVLRLIGALEGLEPMLRIESRGVVMPLHLDIHTFRGTQILTLQTTIGNVDLLSAVDGVGTYNECLSYATVLPIGEDQVPVLTYDGLVAAKRAAGRGKDLFVLPELEALAEIEREVKERERGDGRDR